MEHIVLRRMRTAALAVTLAAGVGLPAAVPAYAADDEPEANDKINRLFSSDSEDENAPKKSESVYVFAKADGSVKNTVVSAWLQNPQNADTLNDLSNLADIENTGGDEGFSNDGGNLVWNAAGNDIHYQGSSDKAAPVSMKVVYWLDGAEIAPADLAGKSGHLRMRYEFANDAHSVEYVAGAAQTVYTPFVCLTGMTLDNNVFSNVATKNAKVVDDGDRTMVGGITFPGLQEDLDPDRDTIDLPAYFEVEADVTDFKMGATVTIATNDLFSGMNPDELDSDLGDSIGQLQDAMGQLVDGESQLYDGMKALDSGSHALADGAGSLSDGVTDLPAAASQIAQGASQLADNTAKTGSGVRALKSALDGDGSDSNPGIIGGLKRVSAGVGQVMGDPATGNGGLAQMRAALDGVNVPSLDDLASVTAQIQQKSAQAAEDSKAAQASASNAGQAIAAASSTAAAEIDAAMAELDPEEDAAAIARLEAAKDAIAQGVSEAQAEAGNAASSAETAQALSREAADEAAGITPPDTDELHATIAALKTGLDGASEGLSQVATALNGDGSESNPGLVEGLGDVSDSLGAIDSSALAPLSEGARSLAAGASQMESGFPTLVAGITALRDGSDQLAQGMDAATDGTGKLLEGMSLFNSEGIQKIADAYSDNVAGFTDRLKATVQASKSYSTFSGKSDSMRGSVRFIYETEAIE